jgi:hypothetical protein
MQLEMMNTVLLISNKKAGWKVMAVATACHYIIK